MLDEDSQHLFDIYIQSQITGDISELVKYREDTSRQYFGWEHIPVGQINYIDVGAFTGDTLKYVFQQLRVNHYYAMEPDYRNILVIKQTIKDLGVENKVSVIDSGAYSEEGYLSFNSSGSSSSITNDGKEKIHVIKMDSLKDDLEEGKDICIKMDIEGSEKNALEGAKELILGRKPFLAISVYHRIDDLITIPRFIEMLHPKGYNYGLGYYGNNYRELVFYATPRQ